MTLNAMFLGIMGEYIGRIFLQSKDLHRPMIERELNPTTDDGRAAGKNGALANSAVPDTVAGSGEKAG